MLMCDSVRWCVSLFVDVGCVRLFDDLESSFLFWASFLESLRFSCCFSTHFVLVSGQRLFS